MSDRNLVIRAGKPEDAPDLAAIFRASWELAYRGVIPYLDLERLIGRRGEDWWRRTLRGGEHPLVLEVAGTVAGYATYGAARWKGPYEGEIFEIYLDPAHQGLGFGEHLFESARQKLDHRRLKGLLVWALTDNTGACEFYKRRGGRPIVRTCERFGKVKLEKLGFGWQ